MKRVVVLYSAPLDFPATELAERGIREVLLTSTDFQIQLFSEYLDLSRFRDAKQREALAELLRYRYAEGATDLVIGVDVPAANFLLEHAGNVFPGVPLVMCSIPEIMAKDLNASPLRERISGVFEPTSTTSLVETALSLKPDTKQVALIAGAFENDLVRALGLRRTIEALGNGVPLTIVVHFQVRRANAWIWEDSVADGRLRYALRYKPHISHFSVEANLLEELEALYREVLAERATGAA